MGDLVQGVFPGPLGSGAPESLCSWWGLEKRLWWLLWSRCPGVGWSRLHAIDLTFGGLEAAWHVPSEAFSRLPGCPGSLPGRVDRFRAHWGRDPLPRLMLEARAGRGVLLPGDPPWPEGVRRLARPPLALYWLGRGSLWPLLVKRRAVAVVGTRRPSLHGLTMARRLGASLADAGWPVVSGLAEGIDGAAHEGCLERGGAPVGVLGTPLERSYPRHHAELQKRVGRQGLLVSEQAPGTSVLAAHFARRNRLQVALAAAVVVVECPLTSGALHSAELAWKEELPLWVVPADAGKASAAGSNRLLAQGATPLLTPADLIDQLGPGPLASRVPAAAGMSSDIAGERAAGRREVEESGQRALLAAVGGGASLEQLSLVLGWPAPELAARLLELELAGRLCPEPGLCWRPR
jgi:DNA processing protein